MGRHSAAGSDTAEGGRCDAKLCMKTLGPSMREAIRFGTLLGLVGLAFNLANNLGNLDATTNSVLSYCGIAAMVACSAAAGLRGTRATGCVTTGTRAGLVTGLVGAVLCIITLFVLTFWFNDTIRNNALMQQDFARSGMADIGVFIIADAIGGSLVLLVVAAAVGAGVGTIGALLGQRLGSLPSAPCSRG